MARARLAFRQTDVTRAVRAVKAAGESVAKVRVENDGAIIVIVGEPDKTKAAEPDDPLDRWMAKHADAVEGN